MYRNIIIFAIIFVYVRTRLFCPRSSCPVSETSLNHSIPDTRVKLPALVAFTGTGGYTGTGGAVCKGVTPLVEQPGGRGFKPRLRSLLD